MRYELKKIWMRSFRIKIYKSKINKKKASIASSNFCNDSCSIENTENVFLDANENLENILISENVKINDLLENEYNQSKNSVEDVQLTITTAHNSFTISPQECINLNVIQIETENKEQSECVQNENTLHDQIQSVIHEKDELSCLSENSSLKIENLLLSNTENVENRGNTIKDGSLADTSLNNNSDSLINLTIEYPNIMVDCSEFHETPTKRIKSNETIQSDNMIDIQSCAVVKSDNILNSDNTSESNNILNSDCLIKHSNLDIPNENVEHQRNTIQYTDPVKDDLKSNLTNMKILLLETDQNIDVLKNSIFEKMNELIENHNNDILLLKNENKLILEQCEFREKAEYEDDFINTLNTLFPSSHISILHDSLNTFKNKFVECVDQVVLKNNHLKNEIHEKDEKLAILSKEHEILKIKSNMLEESVEYFHKYNENFKLLNNQIRQKINIITAVCNNLQKVVGDIDAFKNELYKLFCEYQDSVENRLSDSKEVLADLKNKAHHLYEMVLKLNFSGTKDKIISSLEGFESFYSLEISNMKTTNDELTEECKTLKSKNIELKEKNDELQISIKEMKDEIELRESYAKELEKSTEDLLKSNKFYEDQLITSDNVIKSLKDSKMKNGVEFASEIEKLKKTYAKENGLLRLRIEELENELYSKNDK